MLSAEIELVAISRSSLHSCCARECALACVVVLKRKKILKTFRDFESFIVRRFWPQTLTISVAACGTSIVFRIPETNEEETMNDSSRTNQPPEKIHFITLSFLFFREREITILF